MRFARYVETNTDARPHQINAGVWIGERVHAVGGNAVWAMKQKLETQRNKARIIAQGVPGPEWPVVLLGFAV